ncbi:hypothetical protein HAP32_01482 [Serratia fonticola]|nr:hypothetical protein HAP32_01482 [Serratia fonticola]
MNPNANRAIALALAYLVPSFPSAAATLTCTPPGAYVISKTQPISGTTNWLASTDRSTPMYPALHIRTTQGVRDLTVSDIVMTRISVNDQLGTKYATPTPAEHPWGPMWRSPTPVPRGSTRLYWSYSYRIVPSDGSTLSANAAFSVVTQALWTDGSSRINDNVQVAVEPATHYGTNPAVYNAPNQHNFGDIAPATTGTPLVLPAPLSGNLHAAILWNGPAGTTMTRKIGSGSAVNVKPGSTSNLDTAGTGLQLDLLASDTASPGAITGNLTLTLTCP